MSDVPMEPGQALEVHGSKCGALNRRGTPCGNPAGFKTDHVGVGRCHLHGGRTPVKHGRYSSIRPVQLRKLVEQHQQDPDPLNLLPELATARALLEDYLQRKREKGEPIKAFEVLGLVEGISRVVKRIEDIRSQDAISRPELLRVMTEMGRNAEHRITQLGRRVEELLPPEKRDGLEDLLNQARMDLLDDWTRIRVA